MTTETLAALLDQKHGIQTEPESHCPGRAGLTLPLPHGAAIWISEQPDGDPGFVAEFHSAADSDGWGRTIEVEGIESLAVVADTIAAVARAGSIDCNH
ncbi:hypothetical protein ACFTZI_32485 [Streptomyces decoyicus]|uniref:hypothetical protein n=1 Tax=Streptomyces decoyicus TaxID=249567 RepID=UPI0036288D72